jgi:hypothetical protein
MRTRLTLLVVVAVLVCAQGCRGKRRGPYLAPEPARISQVELTGPTRAG